MFIHTNTIKDKVEFFQAKNLESLEKQISEKIEDNQAIMLGVHHVEHNIAFDPKSGQRFFTALVHFKVEKQ